MRRRFPHLVVLEDRTAPAMISFPLVTASSSLALSGSAAGAPLAQQGPGSLIATYSGMLGVDLDLAAGTIAFIESTTVLDANVSGKWQPGVSGAAGSAPADYGGQANLGFPIGNVLAAVRDGVFTLFASAQPLGGTGSTRTVPGGQSGRVVNGFIDYSNFLLGSGREPLSNNTGANNGAAGSLQFFDAGFARLTVPFDVTINDTVQGQPVVIRLQGPLVGEVAFPVVDLNGAAAGFDTTIAFTGGAAAVALAPSTTVARQPAGSLTGATIALTGATDGIAESLAIDLAGTGLTTTGYNAATGTLTITGSATPATYQTVLRTLTYRDSLSTATPGARSVSISVTDGVVTSQPRTAVVNVTPGASPARVTGVQINDGASQRSRVASLTVTFDADVQFAGSPAAAFSLTRVGGGSVAFNASASVVAGSTVVILDGFSGAEIESGSLRDGRYVLTALAGQISTGAGMLDGDNDGVAGGDFTTPTTNAGVFRFFGDANGDARIDISDFGFFSSAYNRSVGQAGYLAYLDYNNDGRIDITDFGQFSLRYFTSLP